jgi:hypothetical protein
MNLKSRLSSLQRQAGAAPAAPKPGASELRARIAQLEKRRSGQSGKGAGDRARKDGVCPLDALGESIADGLIRIHMRVPLSAAPGAAGLPLHDRPARLPGEPDNAWRNVYIDTETTGLSGGSGTLAFLIGVAVVDAGAIQVTQLLITRFAAEAAMLSALAELFGDDDRLVSYNGKSYDLPLLLSRFRMRGLSPPFDQRPHLDLLHPVRRLFGRRWHDCRLVTLEQRLLGLRRVDDLPGSEAPAAWFDYLRYGRPGMLIKVVEHNRQDIVSLAVAHQALGQAIAQPNACGVDLHALARWLAEQDEDRARALLQDHRDALCDDGRRLLGRLLRRAGDWPGAIGIWESLAARGCIDSLERLAKYHEHVSRDLAEAKRCCDLLPRGDAKAHRHARLARKTVAARGPLLQEQD